MTMRMRICIFLPLLRHKNINSISRFQNSWRQMQCGAKATQRYLLFSE